jgi:hypothetical protein
VLEALLFWEQDQAVAQAEDCEGGAGAEAQVFAELFWDG